MRWAQLLKRVFDIDIERCALCGGQLKLIAAIEEPAVIARILTHLGLAAQPPPRAPARRVDLFQAAYGTKSDWFLTGLGRCSDCARASAQMEWNSGELDAEIVCEVEKSVRNHHAARAAACVTAPLSADTVTNREKGSLKFLYPRSRLIMGWG